MTERRLGKLPARPGAVRLRMASLLRGPLLTLPPLPASFGHEGLIGRKGWLTLGNDKASNCVYAGAAHEHMMHSRIVGQPLMFDTRGVNSDYSARTGYDPARPETDGGEDMALAATYRRQVGVVDSRGDRHRIAAYVALDPGNMEHLWMGLYLFGAVGIGLNITQLAMDQVDRGVAWDVGDPPGPDLGGHYVPLVGRHYGELRVVTWGCIQPVTEAFLRRYCDEALAYIFPDSLVNRRSPEGFDYDQLTGFLKEIGR